MPVAVAIPNPGSITKAIKPSRDRIVLFRPLDRVKPSASLPNVIIFDDSLGHGPAGFDPVIIGRLRAYDLTIMAPVCTRAGERDRKRRIAALLGLPGCHTLVETVHPAPWFVIMASMS